MFNNTKQFKSWGWASRFPPVQVSGSFSPVFLEGQDELDVDLPFAFVATRAHHADVGGMSPGSMPIAREIYQEGLIIPPIKLVK